jgi:hypothetical protein
VLALSKQSRRWCSQMVASSACMASTAAGVQGRAWAPPQRVQRPPYCGNGP